MESKGFKVIIVGGSIAGLTLAHTLSRIGIDYVVLEKREYVAPKEGASILILPHGGRILEQLGLFKIIEQSSEPLHTAHIHFPDGFEHTNTSPGVFNDRFGLPLAFLERQKMLEILFDNLPDKSKILCGKKITQIEDFEDAVTVHTDDGNMYKGDLVVGADGVHSRVRAEMWRLAEETKPSVISAAERKSMTVQYVCAFGISSDVAGLVPGEQVCSFNDGRSFLTFPGKDGRVFWFLVKKLEQKHPYSHAPRFSSKDVEPICRPFMNDKILENVRFSDLWTLKKACSVIALEENVFQTWGYRRIVCIGDSMHKMTPNTGEGANCAIEDVAALANMLNARGVTNGRLCKLSTEELSTLFEDYSKTRFDRISSIYNISRLVVRLHIRDTLLLRLLGRYYMPHSGDLPMNVASKMIAGAVALDFLPLPSRSGPGWKIYKTRKSIPRWVTVVAATSIMLMVSMCLRKFVLEK
ncbi:uncharacterized protein N7443_002168 [Penicillium atrosanguineum]|uniref:uncharacterized protein n=1 Tax=Penicillium atrosanguineum TaxID=1132637 RepID=UPI0023A4254F|nr:uncharacterized protein N7443_002168 [Penicillium atrosanguineum]KAJ5309707.1 hypothetical protein N7443_002168 [Penicillium atrosanguineum]